MNSARTDDGKSFRMMRFLLTELCESEKNLSKKALKMKTLIENALNQDISILSSEEQVLFSNAFAHYILLAEDVDPFQEIRLDNINIEFISNLIQTAEEKINSDRSDSNFRKRAISILWLTLNYEDLKLIFIKLNLLDFETDDCLISPSQRLMKFHLFANQLTELLNSLSETEELIKAKTALNRLQLRAKAIATITNDIFTSIDPLTKKTLLKSFTDVFIRKVLSQIITKVMLKEPNDNFGALTIDIRSEIQKELAEVYKVSSIPTSLWQEPERKDQAASSSIFNFYPFSK